MQPIQIFLIYNKDFDHKSIGFLGHDVVELIEAEVIVIVGLVQDVSIVHHLGDLIIIQGLSQLFGNSFETIKINHSVSFWIPKIENFCKPGFGFVVTHC